MQLSTAESALVWMSLYSSVELLQTLVSCFQIVAGREDRSTLADVVQFLKNTSNPQVDQVFNNSFISNKIKFQMDNLK